MRETTRVGRRIRHVAPGHVVDVATGMEIHRQGVGVWIVKPAEGGASGWQRSSMTEGLKHISRMESATIAAGVCALVRGMLAIGGAS